MFYACSSTVSSICLQLGVIGMILFRLTRVLKNDYLPLIDLDHNIILGLAFPTSFPYVGFLSRFTRCGFLWRDEQRTRRESDETYWPDRSKPWFLVSSSRLSSGWWMESDFCGVPFLGIFNKKRLYEIGNIYKMKQAYKKVLYEIIKLNET